MEQHTCAWGCRYEHTLSCWFVLVCMAGRTGRSCRAQLVGHCAYAACLRAAAAALGAALTAGILPRHYSQHPTHNIHGCQWGGWASGIVHVTIFHFPSRVLQGTTDTYSQSHGLNLFSLHGVGRAADPRHACVQELSMPRQSATTAVCICW
jgi:hypothetical protein